MQHAVTKPGCYWIRFTSYPPNYFELRSSTGDLYYFRWLNKVPRIKFNILHPDTYTSNVPFEIVKVSDVEIPTMWPTLPPPERDRWPDEIKLVHNPKVTGTPIRIYSEDGLIEYGNKFMTYPPVLRLFLILHETGHFWYLTEEYCDLWALINYLRMGYNRSMAYYALTNILSRSPQNLNRINFLFNEIQKTQKEKL